MEGAASNGDNTGRAIAVVGLAAILPDAPDVGAFWTNVTAGRYSINDIPEGRWDPCLYYDADPTAPDKTYSRIGGWVREWDWDPLAWRLPIPPKVGDAMDDGQKWAIACTRAALADFGYPGASLDPERTAVILGNAMAGELHYMTALRIYFPEFAEELEAAPAFEALPPDVREAIVTETRSGIGRRLPPITEDTMPGELGNIIAGRVANIFDFHGPNFVVDAACASTMAAMEAAVQGLVSGDLRWDRPQPGCVVVHQVQQDRGPVRHRHAPVRRGRGWVRDGRGSGRVRAQASGRRRTGRRPGLRGRSRPCGVERRAGQGDHRAEPDRPAAGRGARLARRRIVAEHRDARRGARHLHQGRRRGRGGEPHRGVR
jgi:hypothetical protein